MKCGSYAKMIPRLAGLLTCLHLVGAFWGSKEDWEKATSIYDFNVIDIDGNEVSMEKYRGHVVIIVNVATEWGLADTNYRQLQAMHDELAESKGLRILAFPCNQFANQEPGTNAEIKAWAKKKFGVTFDMFSKINVNGDDAIPLYKYLKSKQGGTLGSWIKWNYTKFLVDKNGQPVARYSPQDEPFEIKKVLHKYW